MTTENQLGGVSASPEILKVLNAFLLEKSRTNTDESWSMELANGLKIQGGPLKVVTSVITFVVPFTNTASISLAFSQTGASSGSIERIALGGQPTTTSVALEKNIDSRPFAKYASWLAVGF